MLTLVEKQSRHNSQSKRMKKSAPRRLTLRPLSSDELCQVNLATFREGFNHCRWPREVVERFLAVQA
jgi:hypothetical protein